ncbi:MAG TPA: glycosyltransferase [Candidatus Polarisedimenticolaceae bacterium]|nr:glycosyltransferase [Candidatus Polarisedimenticolaceae bacterium]
MSFVGLNQRALLGSREQIEEARQELAKHCSRVAILPMESERWPLAQERAALRSLITGSYDEAWMASKGMRRTIREEQGTFQPDVVHFDTVGLAQYLDEMNHEGRVLNHHNIESQMMSRRADNESSSPKRRVLALQARRLLNLERRTASSFDAHLTVSDLDATRLREVAPGASVVVVPNGVDVDYFAPRHVDRQNRTPSLVFVGGLNWYPNSRAVRWFLDEIYPRIRARVPACVLTVVGKDPPADIARAAEAIGAVRLTGEVDDIRPFVSESDVYVCPMQDGGGTRLKILDALAQGKPLVATRMAVEGIPLQDGVHALLADEPVAFAEAVVKLLEDRDRARSLADAGRDFVVQRFGWPHIGERLRMAYDAALRASRDRGRALP